MIKKAAPVFTLAFLLLLQGISFANLQKEHSAQLRADKHFGKLPLRFERNQGQTAKEVRYFSRGPGYRFFLTPTESVMMFNKITGKKEPTNLLNSIEPESTRVVERSVLRMAMVGANPEAKITGQNQLESTSHYLIGNDQSKWKRDIKHFGKVHYKDIYPGIDLVYYGNQQKLEYDFIVKPSIDPKSIQLGFSGADSLSLDDQGNLILDTKAGQIIQRAPVLYQIIEGNKQSIEGRYVLQKNNRVSFSVAEYQTDHELIIDPVLEFSTYLGGTGDDLGRAIGVDSAGNVYIAGDTNSTDFDTLNPIEGDSPSNDIYVAKISQTNGVPALVYSTYIGGNSSDIVSDMAVHPSGDVYVTGFTFSTDFNTVKPIEGHNGSNDAFVLKLVDNSGSPSLAYSTYLGGSSSDTGAGIAVDSAGNAYVTGYTLSPNFNTVNPLEGFNGNNKFDVFVSKIEETPASLNLVYSTFLGGQDADFGNDIAIDSSGNAYVTGYTLSTDFDQVKSIEGATGGRDVIVFKIAETPSGLNLVYSTYLGGTLDDTGDSIALDSAGNAYVSGWTNSTDFDTVDPIEGKSSGTSTDAIVFKLEESANSLSLGYSTYLGGSNFDFAESIAIDSKGNAVVAGITRSDDFDTVNPIEGNDRLDDVMVFKLRQTPAGLDLPFSTYLGGFNNERADGVAVDSAGSIYAIGQTSSRNFNQVNAIEGPGPGFGNNTIFFKIAESDNTPPVLTPPTDVTTEAAGPLTSVAIGTATATDNVTSPANIIIYNDAPAQFPVGATVVTWTAEDQATNQATAPQNITVQDTTAPAITILGANPINAEIGQPYVDPWATATDLVDSSIQVTATSQAGSSAGVLEVIFSATDAAGNTATATRIVNFVDTTPPVITINGANPINAEIGEPYIDPWATAVDAAEGPLQVTATSQPGANPNTTEVTYSASDSSGNTATATRVVNFVDTTPPVITILGANPINATIGQPYVDPWATAVDGAEGPIPVTATSQTGANPSIIEVIYSAADSSGNTSTATRIVNLVP